MKRSADRPHVIMRHPSRIPIVGFVIAILPAAEQYRVYPSGDGARSTSSP